MVPLITCEISCGQHVCELVFGVNIKDLDLGVPIGSVKQPSSRNSVSSWNVSHCWTSSLNDHIHHSFVILKMYNWDSPWEECAFVVTWSTCDNWSTSRCPFCLGLDVRSLSGSRRQFPAAGLVFGDLVLFDERNTSIVTSRKSKAGSPSILNPASNETISDSVELWDTYVCFLHIQLVGTNVRLPKTHKIHPEVGFESSRSPAKFESWNKPNRQCCAVLPTWQYCR